MTDDPGRAIAVRDEVLELLYWLEGEGFADGATPAGLTRFLAYTEQDVRATLQELVRRGDVVERATGEYRLTAGGRDEGARRFAAEFAPLLAAGHGGCNDPECDCHAGPTGGAECHGPRGDEDHPRHHH